MTKRTSPQSGNQGSFSFPGTIQKHPATWRSLEEKADPSRNADARVEESGVQVQVASLVKGDRAADVSRRNFMLASAATAAAATATGCIRRPAEQILPHTRAPEYALPGIALHYASVLTHNGEALGVLVEQHEGRPTKIEGNGEHPAANPSRQPGLGSSDIATQAAILDLYDADRSGTILHKDGESRTEVSWPDFDEAFNAHLETLEAGGGAQLAVLHEPITSPTFLRAKQALLRRFPQATFHAWSSVNDANARAGIALAIGRRARPVVDYSAAKTILSLDCDFLQTESGAVRNARLFAQGRRLVNARGEMNRLYVVESTLSTTGSSADHRLRMRSGDVLGYAKSLARSLVTKGATELSAVAAGEGGVEVPSAWTESVADELIANRGRSVVVVGSRQPAALHALAAAINSAIGAHDGVIQYVDVVDVAETDPLADLQALAQGVEGKTLVILGGNPVYDAPADINFAERLATAAMTVHVSSNDNETSELCTWHVPMAHALESWCDQQSIDGTIAIQQPLIAPIRGGRNAAEMLGMMAGMDAWRGYHAVRQTAANIIGDVAVFEQTWRDALHRGVLPREMAPPPRPSVNASAVSSAMADATAAGDGWEVVFAACPKAFDGRAINNPWLLELPHPITKLTWDNAAHISPASASELGVQTGGMLRIALGELSLEIPAIVVPGHADQSVTLSLGWGRSRAGAFANGIGFNVGVLRTAAMLGFGRGFAVSSTGARHVLAITQEHHSMDTDPTVPVIGRVDMPERPLAIVGSLEQYREQPDFAQWREPTPSSPPLWREEDYATPRLPAQGGTSWTLLPNPRPAGQNAPLRHAWGMVIDLTTCTGCSACTVACTAENNIATVGKQQVLRGREMHWIRLDRYFVGEDIADPVVAFQPVACQHCEEAPCENVCPVNATEHSPEGLNEMAYNRCIGTRYCMNNCPYKVRRFNYLAYNGHPSELQRMQFNPNVSVRMRGVMEKCTYCIQRIQAGKIAARNDGDRRPVDGEITPACAQACPSQALTFGDLNDPEARVTHLSTTDRHYKLLAQIGTQPRTTYLARIRNLNTEMV